MASRVGTPVEFEQQIHQALRRKADLAFTAELEGRLDEIARGRHPWGSGGQRLLPAGRAP